MKYKAIKGLANDFTASFMSGYCWSTVEDLMQHVWLLPKRQLLVSWKPAELTEVAACSVPVQTYCQHYVDRLPVMAAELLLNNEKLINVRTTFRYNSRLHFEAETVITDDRGKEHKVLIR